MADSEITNPAIRVLDNLPVTVPDCRRSRERIADKIEKTTNEFMAVQRETLLAVNQIGTDVKIHLATHAAANHVNESKIKSGIYYIGMISLGVTVTSFLVLAIWKLATALSH